MHFVEIKFIYKNHVLELNLKIENLSKRLPQKPENSRLNHKRIKIDFVGKVPKIIFIKFTQKSINFGIFFVEKVPKCSIFNVNLFGNE